MLEVTDDTFERDVLDRSTEVPVVVDLWAEWCGPCRTLGPILERVVGATDGKVELVKVDVDANPRVASTFQVQSIPAVFALKDRKIVDSFIGAIPEPAVREFVDRLAPVETEADRLVAAGDEASLRQALELQPDHAGAIVALAELLAARVASVQRVRFTNSGTEAALLAARIAVRATGRRRLLMFDGAYHGSATLFLPGSPDVVRVPWNDLDAVVALLGRPGHDIAAVFAEPFLGAGGVRPAAPGFLADVAGLARDRDVLFVLDEVQGLRNGFGGEQGRLGLTPDLTLLFDLSVPESAVRTRRRVAAKHTDRLDSENVEFHERVREAYLKIAKSNPQRVRVIDAHGSSPETHEMVMDIVIPFLKERGFVSEERRAQTRVPRT